MNEKNKSIDGNKIYKYKSSLEEWREVIRAMQSKRTIQIDKDMFDYWLEVLPPVYMHKTRNIDVNNDGKLHSIFCSFGYAEGYDYIIDFWVKSGKYFCKQSDELKTWN